jgi:WD40 repeat protein
MNPKKTSNPSENGSILAGHSRAVMSLALSSDGASLFSGDDGGEIRQWHLPDGVGQGSLSQTHGITSLAIVPGQAQLLAGGKDGSLTLWDVKAGRQLYQREAHYGAVSALALHPDGRRVLTASEDACLQLWDISSGKRLLELERHPAYTDRDGMNDLISSDNREFAYHDVLQDLAYGRTTNQYGDFYGHADAVTSAIITPNGRWVCSGSRDHTVRMWSLSSGKCVWIFGGRKHSPRFGVDALIITPNGKTVLALAEGVYAWRLASGIGIGSFWRWNLLPNRSKRIIPKHADLMAMSPDGKFLALANNYDRFLGIFSRRRGKSKQIFPTLSEAPHALTLSSNLAIVGFSDGGIRIWEFK